MATSPRKEERKKKKDASKDVCPLVIAGTGSAYSGPQCWDSVVVQSASPGRKRELVGVCLCMYEVSGGVGIHRKQAACRYL